MKIKFTGKNTGEGTITFKGTTYDCLGKSGYEYPTDSTINIDDKEENHYSKEFKCDLPWAIRLDGTKGIYFHEDITSGDLSHGNTHGCINLKSDDA